MFSDRVPCPLWAAAVTLLIAVGPNLPAAGAASLDGKHFEGDIIGFGPEDAEIKKQVGPHMNAIVDPKNKWPDNIVPYTIHSNYGEAAKQLIRQSMDEFEQSTCIRFRPRTGQADHVAIIPTSSGCSSWIGRVGNAQTLSLPAECLTTRTIKHELMHAIGFFHEQARTDRDDHVEVNWDNILPGNDQKQFLKYTEKDIDGLGQSYDLDSIMHYQWNAFAINKKVWTIRPKPPNQAHEIGVKDTLSSTDIRKINLFYGCPQNKKKVCGILYETTNFRGGSLKVTEGDYEEYFKTNSQIYRSADILSTPGCSFHLTTFGDEFSSVRFLPGKYDRFQTKHQTRMKTVSCECDD